MTRARARDDLFRERPEPLDERVPVRAGPRLEPLHDGLEGLVADPGAWPSPSELDEPKNLAPLARRDERDALVAVVDGRLQRRVGARPVPKSRDEELEPSRARLFEGVALETRLEACRHIELTSAPMREGPTRLEPTLDGLVGLNGIARGSRPPRLAERPPPIGRPLDDVALTDSEEREHDAEARTMVEARGEDPNPACRPTERWHDAPRGR